MITGNEPTQPVYFASGQLLASDSETKGWMEATNPFIGLTIRQHFAALAMQGLISDPTESDITPAYITEFLNLDASKGYNAAVHYPMYVAKAAVSYADALITELNKTNSQK